MVLTTKKIALTALMTALTAVLTLAAVPLPGGGYYNFGDAVIFVSSATLGPFLGALTGGIGGALGDLCLGYTLYAPFTLAIKAVEGLVAGSVFKALKTVFNKGGNRVKNALFLTVSGIVGGLLMAAGYFVAEGLLLAEGRWQGGIVNLPWNVLQGVLSAAVAAVLLSLLRADKLIDKVLLSRQGNADLKDGCAHNETQEAQEKESGTENKEEMQDCEEKQNIESKEIAGERDGIKKDGIITVDCNSAKDGDKPEEEHIAINKKQR